MAQIDSGLGWSCDSDYYVENAGTLLNFGSDGTLTKVNDGACIAGVCKVLHSSGNIDYDLIISSTKKEHITCTNSGYVYALNAADTFVVDGKTIYCKGYYNDKTSLNKASYFSGFPIREQVYDAANYNLETALNDLLAAANFQKTDTIPTTGYVKSFIEGVEAETAARIKSNTDKLNEKQPKIMSSAISVDGVSQTTVEGALGAVNTLSAENKSSIGTLSDLITTAKTDLVSAINELKGTVYGFHIDPSESDPADCVTYLMDAVGMIPASMSGTSFNYGSWENAFFIPKPCMLKFDGTVDYYLDPNDYTKKTDGTASDIADLSYGGNAMMEFPLIWYKWEQGAESGEGSFYVADYRVDSTYKCWSNLDCDGNIIDNFYLPIYNGCTYNGKMRSISGLTLAPWSTAAYSSSSAYAVGDVVNHDGKMYKCITAVETAEDFDSDKWQQFAFSGNTSGTEEIAQAAACNTTSKAEWYIDQWCDRVLINGLLVLMGKSLDTQGVFGRGIDSGSQAAKEAYVTGSLNNKGLFYGSTSDGNTAVKVFGMENWWALVWRRTAGFIGGANNTYLYKMTASVADGSTADGYNTSGIGYLSVGNRPASAEGWLKKLQFGYFGFIPLEVGDYSTQYYKDHYWTGTNFAVIGGASMFGSDCGAFYISLTIPISHSSWSVGTAPSCKPCLIKEV